MGCGEINTVSTVHTTPVTYENLSPVVPEKSQVVSKPPQPQIKSASPKKVDPALQEWKIQHKIPPKMEEISPLPPLKKNTKTIRKSIQTKTQLHCPQPNQSQIVEILKDKQQLKNQFEKAEELCKKKQYAQALKMYKKIDIQDSYLHSQRGYCNYELQNYDKAIQEYLSSLKLKKQHMPTYFRLGLCYYFKQDYDKALGMLQKCLPMGNNPQVYYQTGLCYYQKQNYDKSIEFYNKALQIQPKNSLVLKAKSDSYFQADKYNQAINILSKIVQKQPKNAQIMSQIGHCYYNMDLYLQANKWYQKSLLVNPKDPLIYLRMGQNFEWMAKYDKAIQKLLKGIQLDPKNQNFALQIGNCNRYQKLFDQALQWYKKALKINSNNHLIYQGLAAIYYEKQKYQQAITQCKKGLKLNPQWAVFYVTIADCYYDNEDIKKAIENYKSALSKKEVNQSYCNYMIGKSYYYNSALVQALPFLEQAIKLNPKSVLYQVQQGKCLFELENFSESFKAFTKAKEIYQSNKHTQDQDYDPAQSDYWVSQLNKFIQSAAEWQQKKKIGYVSPQDKEEIKKMRKNFQKKYEAIFGVQKADKKEALKKPVDKQFLEVTSLIHKDKFNLDTSSLAQSPIIKIATLVRNIYNYDVGAFQIFAYIFQEYMWLQKFESKKPIPFIEDSLNKVLQILSEKYPPVSKSEKSPQKPVEFPEYNQIKFNLFTQAVYFQQYDMVVNQIQRINLRAKNDLAPFKEFVYTLQKNYQGNHAKVGMKLPEKKQNMTDSEKDKYQQSLFKVLMRIFEKMFKEISKKKAELLQTIDKKIPSGKKLPLYEVNRIIMSTWIQSINQILTQRKNKSVKTECYISDLVRGKCMFQSIPGLQNAANGVIKMCKEKGYEIMELDNRLLKITQDVVFKIKIKQVVSELQLALQFDTVAFQFGHSFYEIQRCPLGCIFGSSLFLTKDVSQSFLKKVANSIVSLKAIKPVDKENLTSLEFVMDSFKTSSKSHRFSFF